MKGTAKTWITALIVSLLAAPATLVAAQDASGDATEESSSSGAADTAASDEGSAGGADSASDAATASDESTAAAAAESSDELASPSDEADDADEAEGEEEIDRARTEEEAEAAQAATEPLQWRNSFFSWTMGSTFNTFYRGADLSYNPLYYWSFFLTPRWYFSSNVFLVVNQGLYYEFTDDDSATYNHEPQLYDTTAELRAVWVADRFVFIPAVRLTVPVSKLSQAAQRYFNLGLGLTIVANLPEVANGNLALVTAYRRWFGGSNLPVTMGPTPTDFIDGNETIAGARSFSGARSGAGGSADFGDGPSDGTSLGVDRLLAGLSWNLTPVEGLTITLSGFLIWDQGYNVADAVIGVMGNPSGETIGDGRSHWRMFSSYSAQVAYDVQPWLNLGLGISNATNLSPFFASDGSVLSPFNPNTQVYLTGTFTLDGIYETIIAGGEDDGLTPEERQRRRQGLAAVDVGEELDEDEDTDTSGAARPTGTF